MQPHPIGSRHVDISMGYDKPRVVQVVGHRVNSLRGGAVVPVVTLLAPLAGTIQLGPSQFLCPGQYPAVPQHLRPLTLTAIREMQER